jgi:hypothetical protein
MFGQKMKDTSRFTWHLSFHWSRGCLTMPYEKDHALDGGTIFWRLGPFGIEKRRVPGT